MVKIYNEERFMNEFTFGFEFEGWANDEDDKDRFGEWAYDYFNEIARDKHVHIRTETMGMSGDSSIEPDDGRYGGEYQDDCPDCNGGRYECNKCNGQGRISETCSECEGYGKVTEHCDKCDDDGLEKCDRCNGTGEEPDGQGSLLTNAVEVCKKCNGEKWVKCKYCGGEKEQLVRCQYCGGEGVIETDCPECEGNGDFRCETCGGDGYITYDNDDGDPRTFEWNSPVFNVNYYNISKVTNFLYESMSKKFVNTNSSCGFHIHIGFPEKYTTVQDRLWILINLAIYPEMFNKITKYKNFNFTNRSYAKETLHEDIKRVLNDEESNNENVNSNLAKLITANKYLMLRQHPSGTLEWRGPRSFLDRKKIEDIKGFFLEVFYPFVKFITKVVDTDVINYKHFTISKKDIMRNVSLENMRKVVPNSYIKQKYSKFSLEQDNRELSEVYKLFPELFKMKFSEGIVYINDSDKNFIHLSEARFDYNNKLPINYKNLQLNSCRLYGPYLDAFMVKNCNIENFDNINLNYANNYNRFDRCKKITVSSELRDSTFVNCGEIVSLYRTIDCEFKHCTNVELTNCMGPLFNYCESIKLNICEKGRVQNSTINSGIWRSVLISDSNYIDGGSFYDCTIELTNDMIKYDGVFKGCTYVIPSRWSNDFYFHNMNNSPKFFFQQINSYVQKKYATADYKVPPFTGTTLEELTSFLQSLDRG